MLFRMNSSRTVGSGRSIRQRHPWHEHWKLNLVLLLSLAVVACVSIQDILASYLLAHFRDSKNLLASLTDDKSATAGSPQRRTEEIQSSPDRSPTRNIQTLVTLVASAAVETTPTEALTMATTTATTIKTQPKSNDPPINTNAPNFLKEIPIIPLTSCVKYTHRPTAHLKLARQTLSPAGLPPVSLNYLNGSYYELKAQHLYPIQNYQNWYESAVTHVWIAILHTLQGQASSHMVIDGGMNTGFYTTLTAVMEFDVHSFELQLDCFDVTRVLLNGNGVDANFYHIGISDKIQVIQVGEGCHPGYNTRSGYSMTRTQKLSWKHRTHRVMMLPLDVFLDQKRGGRQIALIKLDVEGNEILALRGLQRHLHAVKNIIMEVSPRISMLIGVSFWEMEEQFHRLETAGLKPYLLWLPQIEKHGWFNATYLERSGVRNVQEHPILGPGFAIGATYSSMLWEIENYEKLFNNTCTDGCNLLFSRQKNNDVSFV